jgi:competence CoiA-like predicted nuclease
MRRTKKSMLLAYNSQGDKIKAKNGTRNNKYFCPICGEEVILKKGLIKIPHYAHKPDNTCKWDFWEPESDRHREMKQIIMDNIFSINNCTFAEYEYSFDKYIADVYFEIPYNNTTFKVAVECQCSDKTLEDFIEKNNYYTEMGVSVLWVFNFPKNWVKNNTTLNDTIRVSSMMWEAHKLYSGQIYLLWDDILLGVHLFPAHTTRKFWNKRKYYERRESGDFWDLDELFNECCYEYTVTLKNKREPVVYPIKDWQLSPSQNNGRKYSRKYYYIAKFPDKEKWTGIREDYKTITPVCSY